MKTRVAMCVAAGIGIAALAFAQPKPKTQKEAQDFNAIQQASTVDARIAAADQFVTNHPTSQLKSLALYLAADAAERKNDGAKAIAYAETSLEADPKNYQSMLLISGELARSTRENRRVRSITSSRSRIASRILAFCCTETAGLSKTSRNSALA